MFSEVRHPQTRKLLFRYDPERELIEIVERRVPTLIDLAALKREAQSRHNGDERLERPLKTA